MLTQSVVEVRIVFKFRVLQPPALWNCETSVNSEQHTPFEYTNEAVVHRWRANLKSHRHSLADDDEHCIVRLVLRSN